jgi:hypothetical protein
MSVTVIAMPVRVEAGAAGRRTTGAAAGAPAGAPAGAAGFCVVGGWGVVGFCVAGAAAAGAAGFCVPGVCAMTMVPVISKLDSNSRRMPELSSIEA